MGALLRSQDIVKGMVTFSSTPDLHRASRPHLAVGTVLPRVLLLLAVVLWGYFCALDLLVVWRDTAHVPFYDEWKVQAFTLAARRGVFSTSALVAPYLENREILYRLVQTTALPTGYWYRQIIMTVSFLLLALIPVVVWRMAKCIVPARAAWAVSAAGAVLFVVPQFSEVWLQPINISFTATILLFLWRHTLPPAPRASCRGADSPPC